MADEQTPLFNAGTAIMSDLIASFHRYNRVATGKTVNALRTVVDGNERLRIYGPRYLLNLEYGRQPTGAAGKMGPYQKGDTDFKTSLKLWMLAKGIDEKAFYPIYKSINEKGFPGTPGILTKPLAPENVSKTITKELKELNVLYARQYFKTLFKE